MRASKIEREVKVRNQVSGAWDETLLNLVRARGLNLGLGSGTTKAV